MATEILKSFNHLQNELDEAKSSLKGVDENIKRLIGRDPSELPPRAGLKRPLNDKGIHAASKLPRRGVENEDILAKRRNPNSVFKRLSEKVYEDPVKTQPRGLISKVIPAPKEIPSRQDALDKQSQDERFKARNRRMFGALLGTLQKFQQEETKLKKKEEKRIQIEKKIEQHELQEKEEIKKERQELFLNRRKKQQEIKMIELKMLRMKEYALWEESQKPRTHFIGTKAKPHIHYLPRRMNDKSRELLDKTKKDVEEQIEKKRQAVFEELNHIQDRMKKNFESKAHNHQEVKEEPSNTRHDRHNSDEDSDDDIHLKLYPNEKGDSEQAAESIEESAQEQVNEGTEANLNNREVTEERNEEAEESTTKDLHDEGINRDLTDEQNENMGVSNKECAMETVDKKDSEQHAEDESVDTTSANITDSVDNSVENDASTSNQDNHSI